MNGKFNGIAWQESGEAGAPPVIFIHAFPLDRTQWDEQAALVEKNFRVLRYDVRGLGESEVGGGQYTIEQFADDLFALMDERKIGRAAVCGISMGGYIALRAAERSPERFSALILCDTRSEADGNEAKLKRHTAMKAVQKNLATYADTFMRATLAEETLSGAPAVTGKVRAIISRQSPAGVCGALLAMAARTDTTEALPNMKMPVLILVGEKDSLTPPSASEAMKKSLPDAELRVIPGASHLSNFDRPQVFNEHLSAFLRRTAAKA